MRRLLLVLAVPVLAGCGSVAAVPLPPAHAASPQHADLDWTESIGDASGRVVFGVRSFDVTKDGWRAEVSVTNDTDVAFAIPGSGRPEPGSVAGLENLGQLDFGLMLYATGKHSELESRNAGRSLPTARVAERYEPALPAELAAHDRWAGTISARGPLAAGSWMRVEFGELLPVLDLPGGAKARLPDALQEANVAGGLTWITDHAYQLKLRG